MPSSGPSAAVAGRRAVPKRRRAGIANSLAAVLVVAAAAACSTPRDPIIINDGMLILQNQTSGEWRDVLITVNHHYRGGARSLAPGGRLTAPLRDFKTGFGQKYDPGRMSVFKVVVTAKKPNGEDVRLEWGRE